MIGNMELVNSGFPHPKECLRRLSTIGHALSKMFASPILGRKISRVSVCRGAHVFGRLWVETWLYCHYITAHSSNVLAPLWSMVWSPGQLLSGSAPLSSPEPRNKLSLSLCVKNYLRCRETLQRADYIGACIYVRYRERWRLRVLIPIKLTSASSTRKNN
jgi:hypothetical protein